MTDAYLTDSEIGPVYDIDSAALRKCRRKPLKAMSRAERDAYASAIETAVLAAQRASLRRAGNPLPSPNCASGTAHNTGEAIHKAVRAQHRAALLACPSQERRARTPEKWREMYDAAMAEMRGRGAEPTPHVVIGRRARSLAYLQAARARLAEAGAA